MNCSIQPKTSAIVGFTLLELLVVIAITGALSTLLLAAAATAKQKARVAGCANNLRQIGMAAHSFAADNNGRFPAQLLWSEDAELSASAVFKAIAYNASPSVFRCSAESRKIAPNSGYVVSYGINEQATPEQPSSLLALDRSSESAGFTRASSEEAEWDESTALHHASKGNVLQTDGSVTQLSDKGLRSLLKHSLDMVPDDYIYILVPANGFLNTVRSQ